MRTCSEVDCCLEIKENARIVTIPAFVFLRLGLNFGCFSRQYINRYHLGDYHHDEKTESGDR